MRNQTRQLIKSLLPNALWLGGAFGLILFAWTLTRLSSRFGYDWAVIDMPIARLAALLVTAGAIFVAAAFYARRDIQNDKKLNEKWILGLVVVTGALARLILFASEPALEDDYQRYLWDGAVTAHGYNPYQFAPKSIIDADNAHPLAEIAEQSGVVLTRINHKELTTIYPPVAQAAFSLAYLLEPFSLISWRFVLLAADFATLALLLAILGALNRSPLWSALYWWNPVVLKEFFNSAHMDALVLPMVLGALFLAIKNRPIFATACLAFGAGTKVWPILLLPLIWRQAITATRQLWLCALIFAALCLLWIAPYLVVGLNDSSGTVAYAQRWTINSPLFATLRGGMRWIMSNAGFAEQAKEIGSLAARGFMAVTVGLIALKLAIAPIVHSQDFLKRALLIVAALILFAPAIYPWYTLWMAPLLVFTPQLGLLLLFATIPLYYTYFYFAAREATALYQNGIVWLTWVPVWTLCFYEWRTARFQSNIKKSEPSRNLS